jgi:hypothetical protein
MSITCPAIDWVVRVRLLLGITLFIVSCQITFIPSYGALCLVIKMVKYEPEHIPPSSAKVQNAQSFIFIPIDHHFMV